ncbi:MAG: hypothetical protein WBF42_03120, partial [Terracidiphilus sp.]
RGTWSAREDRLPSLVWLALIWLGIIAGFGVDMRRFLHEVPPPSKVVHVHAFVFTVWLLILTAQIVLVVKDRVALHRRLGWFAAGWACLMVVFGTWVALVAKGPVAAGPASPRFLAMNFGSILAFVLLLLWGIALRGNPAAHKRVMILATIAILDPGYGRLSAWLLPEPQSMVAWFLWNFYGNVLILALMAAWDVWRDRLMKQFVVGAVGLVALESLQDFLYHWEPWKVFATGLVAGWAKHFG